MPPSPDGLSEHDSKRLLALYGIPVAKEKVVRDATAAAAAAETHGFPVAVKAHGASFSTRASMTAFVSISTNAREVTRPSRR